MSTAADPALDLVLGALDEVLGAGPGAGAPIGPATRLLELPGFDSIALASLVELLEARIGRPLPDEAIVPEAFDTPASIVATLVAPAMGEQAQDGVPL
ncbi:MAG TPA: acyl carrier protein [Pseudonocardia sp.]|nr:acyl carrier protein [Pseudonocardia sp.]